MGKFRKKRLADSNSDAVKTTLRLYLILKWASLFSKFFKNLSPFLCHFVTYNRVLQMTLQVKDHIQVGSLPVQSTWLSLVT